MPLPGRHRPDAALVRLARDRARAGGLRRRRLGPQAFEHGIAAAAAAGAAHDPILVSIFLSGGVDSLSLLAPDRRTRSTRRWRPTLALPAGQGTRSARTRAALAPAAAALATCTARARSRVIPAIGYDDPNQSHFTSRHYWEVGEVNPGGRWGWLGRYLDRHGAADNPLQGLSLGCTSRRRWPRTTCRSRPSSAPEDYDFWTPGVWDDRCRTTMLDAFGDLGRPGHERRRARAGAPGAPRPTARAARPARAASRAASRRPPAWPTRTATSPGGCARWPRCSAAGCRCASSRSTPRRLRHAREPGRTPARRPARDRRSLPAFQADLEARGIADRVLVHVWSEFGRRPRRTARAPTTARAAPAS